MTWAATAAVDCDDHAAEFEGRVGNTPMRTVAVNVNGRRRVLHLKLEGANPGGSIKDRTALALLHELERRDKVHPGSVLVESTSGNLGVALSTLARARGYRFTAVVDPKTSPEALAKIAANGAAVMMVDEPDDTGGYLKTRLAKVRSLLAENPDWVWTNQYANPANPLAHYRSTAPEIYRQMHGRVDAVFVAVSTCGTVAGIGRWFRRFSPATRVVAVDAHGSVVFGGSPGVRHLTGIGSSLTPTFTLAGLIAGHTHVQDVDAFTWCHGLADAAVSVGGSSGAAIHAAVRAMAEDVSLDRVAVICPDTAANYRSTIFSPEWLATRSLELRDAPQVEVLA